jgi:hypothetical protein
LFIGQEAFMAAVLQSSVNVAGDIIGSWAFQVWNSAFHATVAKYQISRVTEGDQGLLLNSYLHQYVNTCLK